MKRTFLCLVLVCTSISFVHGAGGNSPCDDDAWIPFKDEECGKRFQQAILSIRREMTEMRREFAAQLNSNTKLMTDMRSNISAQATQINSNTNLITDTRNTLTTQGTQVQSLQENPVPIGFIYVQLPKQPEPRTIWPTVVWNEVTQQYAGLFFRAQGGESAAFGFTQEDNSPRLTRVFTSNVPNSGVFSITVNATDVVSSLVSTGACATTIDHWGLAFQVSSGEVRPRNQAMRIWRRN